MEEILEYLEANLDEKELETARKMLARLKQTKDNKESEASYV